MLRVLQGLEGLRQVPAGTVLSVGNFDGLHRGHARLLDMAAGLKASGDAAGIAIVTFEPHPLTVLRPELAPPRLTPPSIKQAMLEAAGVDEYVILPPRPEVLNLTAAEFWAILRDVVRPRHLIEGRTFTFGKGRGGTIDRLREWSSGTDITLHMLDPVTVALLDLSVVPVSSSLIRWLLAHGRVRDAAICLGRGYGLRGEVVEGFKRGRTIGVPTANLRVTDQHVPGDGVYAGRCRVADRTVAAAVSIGSLPTFEERRHQIEAHLIGFDGDLYGQTIEVELIDWVREQRKYPGIDVLKQQIQRDLVEVQRRLVSEPSRAIAAA